MTKNIRCAIASAFLAACTASGAALAVDEVEPNSSIADAQTLLIDASRSATVQATLEDGAVDLYAFWAKEGDVVTFDVDGDGTIDTWLTVLLPAPAMTVAASVDDSGLALLDPGSSTSLDPYVQDFVIPADGIYYVAVTALPNYTVHPYLPVLDGGVTNVSRGNMTGSYTLIVSNVSPQEVPPTPDPVTPPAPAPDPATPPAPTPDPVTPPAPAPDSAPTAETQHIRIDIKPGRGMIVRLDPKGKHTIPVALLSSRRFNALSVEVESLTFGRTGEEQSLRRCAERGIDVNRDRRPDLVCEFVNHLAEFELGDSEGIVRGRTKAGTYFEGRGMLKVMPHKRHHHGHHHKNKKSRDDDDDDDDDRKRRWSRHHGR